MSLFKVQCESRLDCKCFCCNYNFSLSPIFVFTNCSICRCWTWVKFVQDLFANYSSIVFLGVLYALDFIKGTFAAVFTLHCCNNRLHIELSPTMCVVWISFHSKWVYPIFIQRRQGHSLCKFENVDIGPAVVGGWGWWGEFVNHFKAAKSCASNFCGNTCEILQTRRNTYWNIDDRFAPSSKFEFVLSGTLCWATTDWSIWIDDSLTRTKCFPQIVSDRSFLSPIVFNQAAHTGVRFHYMSMYTRANHMGCKKLNRESYPIPYTGTYP